MDELNSMSFVDVKSYKAMSGFRGHQVTSMGINVKLDVPLFSKEVSLYN